LDQLEECNSWSHVKFSFFVQGSERWFSRRILQSIRCHLGSFSMYPINCEHIYILLFSMWFHYFFSSFQDCKITLHMQYIRNFPIISIRDDCASQGSNCALKYCLCMYMYSLLFPHSNILAWVCDPIGQTDGRTASHLTTKCFRSMGYQILLGMRLRLRAIGAQELHF